MRAAIATTVLAMLAACEQPAPSNVSREQVIRNCTAAARDHAGPVGASVDWERICECAGDKAARDRTMAEQRAVEECMSEALRGAPRAGNRN